jgi:hypothetical protein
MQGTQPSDPLYGDDGEANILELDGRALNEAGGGIPGIGFVLVPAAVILGSNVDDIVTGVKDAVGAVLSITKIV